MQFGTGVNYLSGSGNITFSDHTGSYIEKYDVSTLELLGVIGTIISINKVVSIEIRGCTGYGK